MKENTTMKKILHSTLLAAVVASVPALAVAQSDMGGGESPTANSAASQVGRNPPSATSTNGQRVEPSDKLWNNPRTVGEQPGTQPPDNNDPSGSATPHGHSHTHPGSEGRSSRGGNKTPSPADSGEQ
ncbi:hypothetical protein B0W47_00090 [Komagataeibacter nataicola]|uniref:Secreted protein n=2 Tax=Komagataeibacter nataicola TaxID=265960 RepID=A0A9N7C377_9PROT|nr:hypothetical protein B0W47_00090 [Komagataeibacter nataicola]PYD67325.1 hypothetical protein CDI09_03660 [Komagataeibacter nataicola]